MEYTNQDMIGTEFILRELKKRVPLEVLAQNDCLSFEGPVHFISLVRLLLGLLTWKSMRSLTIHPRVNCFTALIAYAELPYFFCRQQPGSQMMTPPPHPRSGGGSGSGSGGGSGSKSGGSSSRGGRHTHDSGHGRRYRPY